MNSTGTGAAFRERSNLVCLVTTTLIYPALLFMAARNPTAIGLVGHLVAGVILQVVLLIVLQILVALFTRQEPDDERVRAIEHRASRLSGIMLRVGVFVVLGLTIVQGFVYPPKGPFLASPVFTGYVLFGAVLAAELVRMSLAALGYRRG